MDELAAVAERAVGAASPYLAAQFGEDVAAEYTAGDVTTAADREAERRIIAAIEDRRPDDPISAEESGDHPGSGSIRWVVDPLDGTNNFASGLPTFGTAVTAVENGRPLATAVDLPIVGDRYVATRDGGVRLNGQRVATTDGDRLAVEQATVAVAIGRPVIEAIRGEGDLDRVFRSIVADGRRVLKRVIETWSPVVHWALLARGRMDGVIAIHPDEREGLAGDLLEREAGCARRGDGPITVAATHDALADRCWTVVEDARD